MDPKKLSLSLMLSAVSLHLSADNLPKWDWKSLTPFKAYYAPVGSKPVELLLTSPFFLPGNPLFHVAPLYMDMWEADGWVLIKNDFGTTEEAPRYPNFVMYNQFRGILRAGIFLPEHLERENGYIGQINLVNTSTNKNISPLLTFSAYPNCFSNDYDPNAIERSLNHSVMNNNWLCCDFVMNGYDPELVKKKVYLDFQIITVDTTQVRFNSDGTFDFHLEQESPVTVAGSPAGFANALTALQTGYSIFKNETTALEAVKRGDHGRNASWVAEVVGGAAGVAGLGPIASGLAGAVTSYLCGGAGQSTPVNFKGTLKFTTTGELRNSKILWNFPIELSEKAENGNATFGIFNVQEKPVLLDNITKEGSRYRHDITHLRPPTIRLNPNIGYGSADFSVAYTFDGA